MTTPDPADVHTGTDRVELTDDERAQRLLTGIRERDDDAAALRFINGWMTALTAERDEIDAVMRKIAYEDVPSIAAQRDKAEAELAAANRRCEEEHGPLLRENKTLADELAAANARYAELEGQWRKTNAECIAHWNRADKSEARIEGVLGLVNEARAERDALQTRLDDVAALADRWDAQCAMAGSLQFPPWTSADLRAALTPEGKREGGCGVCLTCDPPQDDPRFGFPIMQHMYVCGTCGNKRCPAAGDCLKWECSGSNATNQVPVPRTREGKP